MENGRFSLNTADWLKVGKGALIASVGAGLTYLSANVMGADFGMYTPVVVAGWSIFVNLAKKFLEESAKEPEEEVTE
jgi:hypothetical protein